MARPRYNGQRFINPIDSLGFHSESRHREAPPLTANFMSNETHFAENQEFNALPGAGKAGSSLFGKFFGRKVATEGAGELAETGAKKGLFGRLLGRRSAGEVGEAGAKEVGGELSEEALETAAQRELTEKAILKSTPNPTRQTMIRWGIGGVVVYATALSALGIVGESVDDIVCEFTGCACDEDALAQGLEEGTDEYREAVEDCQSKAANTMQMVGIAGVAVLGLLAFALLRPKKSEE